MGSDYEYVQLVDTDNTTTCKLGEYGARRTGHLCTTPPGHGGYKLMITSIKPTVYGGSDVGKGRSCCLCSLISKMRGGAIYNDLLAIILLVCDI